MGEEEEAFEWIRGFQNKEVNELLIDEPTLLLMPQEQDNKVATSNEYLTSSTLHSPAAVLEPRHGPARPISISTFPALERSSSSSKVDKYTLKVTNNSNGMIDDGYKWRKYGQKSIKNTPNPRSYYKCTNPICNAKKQVERSIDEPNTYIITYDGLHLHFIYPFFIPNNKAHRPNKKPKLLKHDTQFESLSKRAYKAQENTEEGKLAEELFIPVEKRQRQQGLLEDVVAPAINDPTKDSFCPSLSSSSSSSLTTSPPFSPSLPWSPNFNIGLSDEILELIGSHTL